MNGPGRVTLAAVAAVGMAIVMSCASALAPNPRSAIPDASPTTIPASITAKASDVKITTGTPWTSGRFEAPGYAATRLADGRILLTGGFLPAETARVCAKIEAAGRVCAPPATATAEIHDPRAGSFTPTGSMTKPRRDHQAVLLHDGRVLVTGADAGIGALSPTAEIYDPATGGFSSLGPLHQDTSGDAAPRFSPEPADRSKMKAVDGQTIVVLGDGRVLLAGGQDGLGSSSNAVSIFDPSTNTFANLPGMPVRWHDAVGSLLPDGRVLLTNGVDSSTGLPSDQAFLFDPARGTFTLTGRTVVIRDGSDATVTRDGRVLLVGGMVDPLALQPNCGTPAPAELFDPATGRFAAVGGIRPPWPATTAAMSDGRVLLLGGTRADCTSLRQVGAYDPGTGTVSILATGVLPDALLEDAFALDDGSILLLTDAGIHLLTLK